MRAFFRRHDFLPAHRGNIDNVDHAGIADGDIKVTGPRIKKNYVRSAAEANLTEDTARRGLDREQNPRIARAEQAVRSRIEVETMRAFRWYLILFRYFIRRPSIDCDDPGGGGDIDEERLCRRVINRPAGAARYFDFGNALAAINIHN